MHSDSFYIKGSTHKECQDYAAHGECNGIPYAIVSDGCSSAPHTDIGARLLVRSAIKTLDIATKISDWTLVENRNEFINLNSIVNAQQSLNALELHDDALCATLLLATIKMDQTPSFYTSISGDGFVAAKKGDFIELHEYRFAKGAPYYLRYALDDQMSHMYWQKFGNKVLHNVHTIGKDLYIETFASEELEFEHAPSCFEHNFPLSEYQWVAVMSDGGGSFLEMVDHGTGLEPKELNVVAVMRELLGFKNFQGEFVQRRCVKAFKDFTKKHWQNTDDFAIAAIARSSFF
jgi:hypothetical protein